MIWDGWDLEECLVPTPPAMGRARSDDTMEGREQKSDVPQELSPGHGLCVSLTLSCPAVLSSSSVLQIGLCPSYKGTRLGRITSTMPFLWAARQEGIVEDCKAFICKPVAALEGRHPRKPSGGSLGAIPAFSQVQLFPWGLFCVPSALQCCGLLSPARASCLCFVSRFLVNFQINFWAIFIRQSQRQHDSQWCLWFPMKAAVWSRNPDVQPVLTCLPSLC